MEITNFIEYVKNTDPMIIPLALIIVAISELVIRSLVSKIMVFVSLSKKKEDAITDIISILSNVCLGVVCTIVLWSHAGAAVVILKGGFIVAIPPLIHSWFIRFIKAKIQEKYLGKTDGKN